MRFVEIIGGWINRYFSNEEAVYLIVALITSFGLLVVFGTALAPVLTGLVLAFLLQGLVVRLEHWHVPKTLAVYLTFLLFISAFAALLLFIFPLVWRQLAAFINALPDVIQRLNEAARGLPEAFPTLIDDAQVDYWLQTLGNELGGFGRTVLEASVTQLPSVVGWLIYLILVPISVFFFLKDGDRLMAWFLNLLPSNRPLLDQVGLEMNTQIANYVRGKVIEILIVGSASYVTFALFGLNYAALMALLVGLSVLVPYVGAAVVTLPVVLVALIQWGWTIESVYLLFAYGAIQAIDGNVIVPLLFSEAVDLHPIAIIVAVLAFGGLWGFWGVFFAIPLATLIKAIMNAWPEYPLNPESFPTSQDTG